MPNQLNSKEIVDLNMEYTLYSWLAQGQTNPNAEKSCD